MCVDRWSAGGSTAAFANKMRLFRATTQQMITKFLFITKQTWFFFFVNNLVHSFEQVHHTTQEIYISKIASFFVFLQFFTLLFSSFFFLPSVFSVYIRPAEERARSRLIAYCYHEKLILNTWKLFSSDSPNLKSSLFSRSWSEKSFSLTFSSQLLSAISREWQSTISAARAAHCISIIYHRHHHLRQADFHFRIFDCLSFFTRCARDPRSST